MFQIATEKVLLPPGRGGADVTNLGVIPTAKLALPTPVCSLSAQADTNTTPHVRIGVREGALPEWFPIN